MKVHVELRLWRLREHASIVKLLDDHGEAWLHAFRVFVERHLRAMPTVQLSQEQPIDRFPMTVEMLDQQQQQEQQAWTSDLWCNQDLSAYVQVYPVLVDKNGDGKAAQLSASDAPLEVDPRAVEWIVGVLYMKDEEEEEGYTQQQPSDLNGRPRALSVPVSVHPSIAGTASDAIDAELDDVADGMSQLMNDARSTMTGATLLTNGKPLLSMARTTLVLSCLLQYTPELYGVASSDSFVELRRFIIPVCLFMICCLIPVMVV
jgi:hypothetical protein